MTEITDNIIGRPDRGIVLFDGGCGACTGLANRFRAGLERRGFQLLSLHDPRATVLAHATVDDLMRELYVVTPTSGERSVVRRGLDAVLFIAATFVWLRPLCLVARLPGMNGLFRAAYRAFAARRYRISRAGACAIRRAREWPKWVFPVLLLLAAASVGRVLPAWAWMWTIAGAIFFCCKSLTWWPARRRASSLAMTLSYLFAWPGMDAVAFFGPRTAGRPTRRQWFASTIRTFAGAALLLVVAGRVSDSHPLARGWFAMIGLVATLHFGAFDLIALAWRRAGVNAEPLMLAPTRSRSLADFWGRRWNTGYRALSHTFVFEPLRRRAGVVTATVAAFLVSGLIHDVVISLPARGGYGLPTLYFLIQCAGLLIERTALARRAGLGRGLRGRLYAATFTLVPLPLLFHAAFVHRVIVPFVNTITRSPEAHMTAPSLPSLSALLIVGGLLHLCITSAGLTMTRVLDWRKNLAPLCGLTRHVIWTHGGFVLLTIVGFGTISVLASRSLASGEPLARAVCAFIALFWAIRLFIQFFVFDARPFLTNRLLAVGYHGLTVVFSYFVIVYGIGAVR